VYKKGSTITPMTQKPLTAHRSYPQMWLE